MCTSVFLMPIHTYVYIFTYRYIDLDIDVYIDIYSIYTERSLGTYVSTYACAHVWTSACARSMHSRVRAGACLCMSARACARERRRNATARPLVVCHHVCMCMWECMHVHMCVRVDSLQACASRHIKMRACVDGSASTGAHRYTWIMCMYISRYLSLLYIYYVLTRTHVCGCVRTRCAHRCRCVRVPRQMPRASIGARVFDRHPFI
jgi:hypothetical protein